MNTEALRFSPWVDLAIATSICLACIGLIVRMRRTHHVPLPQFVRAASLLSALFAIAYGVGFLWDFSVGLMLFVLFVAIFLTGISYAVSPVILMGVFFEFLLGIPLHNESFAPPPMNFSASQEHQEHVGREAISCCALRPFGVVQIGNQRFEATSEGGKFIAADQSVIVTGVKRGTLVVALPPNEG